MNEFLDWLKNHPSLWTELTIKVENNSLAWMGLWIGLGIVIAAAIMKGQIVIR